MAIKYYCGLDMLASIDLNQNQLIKPRIENLGSDPAGVEGQIYYNTANDVLKLYTAGGWVTLASTGGGVTTFTNTNGTFVSAGTENSAATGAVTMGTIDLSATGTPSGSTFLRGDNTWAAVPGGYTSWTINGDTNTGTNTVIDGQTVDISGGTAIVTQTSTRTVNINFTPSELSTVTAASTDKVVITDTSDSNNPKLALISDIVSLVSVGVTTVDTTDGTYIDLTPNTATSGAVVVTADLSAVDGTSNTATRFLSKDNTWDVPSYTANTNETYTLPVAAGGANSAELKLTAGGTGSGVKSTVTFNGTSTGVAVSETSGNNGSITIGLQNDVTIGGNLTVTTALDMTSGQINNLANGTANNDAVNLGQVQGLIAGVGLFKGGYNANTGLTTDLGAGNGSLDGASNIALDLGDFFAVTVEGTAFFTETLEPGDMIYANTDIAANSSPSISDYTVVIQDANVAGEGATDGVTDKGVAGFNSAHFSVTSNGFVSADIYSGGSTLGIVPSGGASTTFLRGDGTWVTPANSGGTITSIDITETGTALTITESGSATDPDFNISGAGTSSQVILGDLTLATLPVDGVESVNFKTDGTALNVASNTITGSGTMTGIWQGTSSQYVNGEGDLVTFPSIPQGDIENVSEATANNRLGIDILAPGGPDVTVGLDVVNLGNLGAAPATDDELIIYDTSTATNKAVTIANLASAVQGNNGYAVTLTSPTAAGSPYTVTHSLGSYDVVVQLYNDSSKETIYACVDRTSTNALGISFDASVGSNVRVLVSKVS